MAKKEFEGLARRGQSGLAFYVQVSFLSCHQLTSSAASQD